MSPTISTDGEGPYFSFFSLGKELMVRPNLVARYNIGGKKDLFAKAIGFKKNQVLRVIDATAGFCRDTYHLARLGCEVLAIEENEQIFTVMDHYVREANAKLETPIKLVHANSSKDLEDLALEFKPDVIFLDPMFPDQDKSAMSAKETELLKALIEPPSLEDEANLLHSAWRAIPPKKRIVIKRPRLAPPLAGDNNRILGTTPLRPTNQIQGKSIRYDIYGAYSRAQRAQE